MTVARVSEHAYLSIGDVLDLLKDEFPEITISKIRFLEAQGLIDPERTPSGYRKFYQQDLARLRWILIQQRDHFLPLKVIRDRLEAGTVPEAELVDAGAVFPGAGPSNGFSGGYGSGERSQPDDDVWAAPSPVGERHQGEAGAPEAAASDEVHNGHGDAPSDPDPDLDSAPAPIAAAAGPDADDAHEVGQEPDPEVVGQPAPAFDAAGQSAAGESGAGAMEPTLFDDAAAPVGKQGTAPVDEIPVPTPELVELAAAAERDDLSGVSLTVTELAAAAAMTVADVRELEKYGLLAGDRVGPEVFYDETALQVAQLAGRFRRHGIEPRHLRQYRVNTDREMSLFEQVVAPYVRQRGRMGHSQASASVHELSDLGESLRRALLKRAARDYLGES